jgi:hypothetical protein
LLINRFILGIFYEQLPRKASVLGDFHESGTIGEIILARGELYEDASGFAD